MESDFGAAMFGSAFKAHAFPAYAALREKGPVTRVNLRSGEAIWFVTRYAEAVELLKDHDRFANDPANAMTEDEYAQLFQQATIGLTPEQQEFAAQTDEILSRNLLAIDPPDHSRLRRLVAIPFTPKFIEGLRPRIQSIADTLLDAAETRAQERGVREMELIDDFAYPLPLTVISEMLGIPPEDRDSFREWSQAAVSFTPADPANPEVTAKLIAFIAYLRQLVTVKRANPGEDLLSGLVLAEAEGDKLSENELLSMIFLLIVAGHETTVNLIGNGTLALFDHPEQFARLRQNPDFLKSAIEEMLRYYGPVEVSLSRWVRADTEFGGETMRRGEQIMALLASDNHDGGQFPNPEVFDVERTPNRHVAFGTGIHSCLGATLARLEGQIAFASLLSRMPDLALGVPRDDVQWRDATFLRGLTRLPVTF
ncbi:MAG: cytochrome P450 [Chloroflexota bacterium]|nr:cytochrome P450 [Chloroflexia bacterium]MDQ3226130.1 cytochrome P450 [Chloroflexota bacterium]